MMRCRKAMVHGVMMLALVFCGILPLWAGGEGGAHSVSPWTFDLSPRLLGADLGVGYRGWALLPGVETTIWAYLGGGYESEHFYRDSNGALLSPGEIDSDGPLADAEPAFNRIEAAWRMGIEQGFAWNPRTGRNLLAGFFFYRGRYDVNEASSGALLTRPPLAELPDRDRALLNSLQLGAGYDDLLFDKAHKTKSGISAEVSAEWGPGFLFNAVEGDADFLRFNATFRWFLPLYDIAPERPSNLLSIYLGEYFSVDYALALNGTRVPLYVRQSFGGRDQIVGLGDAVRGVDKGGYDTNLKAVNNLELRVNLPAIFHPDLVPGIVAFLDAGAYDQVGEPGIGSPKAGFVASTGAGVYVDVLDRGSLAAYVEYRLDAANAAGDHLRVFVVEFGMHF